MLHFSIDDNPFTLATDLNGNTTKLPTDSIYPNDKAEFNWDNKLRKAWKGDNFIHVKYDPMGNRVWKHTSEGVNNPVQRKFIVDINSQLPVLLCIADASDPNLLTSTYFYADAQVVHQRQMVDPNVPAVYDSSYYVHDRLGSVRLVVRPIEEPGGWVVRAANSYTYTPYGQFYEGQRVENIANPFKFTGQWHDVEIDQYHLRARQYDPTMMRFTSRDPVRGKYQEPLTLHKYLYCVNSPIDNVDPSGKVVALAASLLIRGLIGGIAGSVSAGLTSDWDARAVAFGFVAGMLSGVVPGPIWGAVAGTLLGGANSAYATWVSGGDANDIRRNTFFGLAGGGMGGIGGAMLGAHAGLFSTFGSASFSVIEEWLFSSAYSAGARSIEIGVRAPTDDWEIE